MPAPSASSFNARPIVLGAIPVARTACVVSLVDRLVHNAEILAIDGESYRLKEAQERSEQRAQKRRRSKS